MKQSVLYALLGYSAAYKLTKQYPDVTFIQEDDDDQEAQDKPHNFEWIDGQDEPKVIMTNLSQQEKDAEDPLAHQLIENPEPHSFEWIDGQD
jgi:hypothetical protein